MSRLYYFILALSVLSCQKEPFAEKNFRPKFIIEGNIEADEYPVVKITHNLPISAPLTQAQVEEIIIRWAKVEVSSATDTEILTLIHDPKHFPYYFYKGRRLKGQLGEHYRITVHYNDILMQGETSIPNHRAHIDSIWFAPVPSDTARRALNLRISDPYASPDFYRFYVASDSLPGFASTSPKGVEKAKFHQAIFETTLYKNRLSNFGDYSHIHFKNLDNITIKVSNMNAEANSFWSQYSDLVQAIPLLGGSQVLKGNMDGPCLGIWYGTASSYQTIQVK